MFLIAVQTLLGAIQVPKDVVESQATTAEITQIVAQAYIASDVGLLALVQKCVGYYQLISKEMCAVWVLFVQE